MPRIKPFYSSDMVIDIFLHALLQLNANTLYLIQKLPGHAKIWRPIAQQCITENTPITYSLRVSKNL